MTGTRFASRSFFTHCFRRSLRSAPVAVLALALAAGCQQNNPPPSGPTDTTGPKSPDLKSKGTGPKPTEVRSTPTDSMTTPPPRSTSSVDAGPVNPDLKSKGTGAVGTPTATDTMAFKDATHMLSKESPYYTSMPGDGAKSDGMWPAGTPVLVTTPMKDYSKVKTATGVEAYVPTANLEAKNNK